MGDLKSLGREPPAVPMMESADLRKAGALSGMSDETRMADGTTFGRSMKNSAGIALAVSDMHERLGQLIAYARTNEVFPPWSMGN